MRKVDFGDTGVDDGLRAGGRAAIMAARFERHVDGRPAGEFARVTQRHDFGMGIAGALCPPPAHDDAVLHHDGTHRRIRAADTYREERFFKCNLKVIH